MQDSTSILLPGLAIAGTLVALVATLVLALLLRRLQRMCYMQQAAAFARRHGLQTTEISLSGVELAFTGSFEGARLETRLNRFHHLDDEGIGLYAEVYQIELHEDPGEAWLIVRRMDPGEEYTRPELPDYPGEYPTGHPRFDALYHVRADTEPTNPLFSDPRRLSELIALNTNAVAAGEGKVIGYYHRNVIWKYNGFGRVERMIRVTRGMVG